MDVHCNLTTLETQMQINSTIFHLVKTVSMCVSCTLDAILSLPLLLVITRPPSLLRHTRFLFLTHLLVCDNLQVGRHPSFPIPLKLEAFEIIDIYRDFVVALWAKWLFTISAAPLDSQSSAVKVPGRNAHDPVSDLLCCYQGLLIGLSFVSVYSCVYSFSLHHTVLLTP